MKKTIPWHTIAVKLLKTREKKILKVAGGRIHYLQMNNNTDAGIVFLNRGKTKIILQN